MLAWIAQMTYVLSFLPRLPTDQSTHVIRAQIRMPTFATTQTHFWQMEQSPCVEFVLILAILITSEMIRSTRRWPYIPSKRVDNERHVIVFTKMQQAPLLYIVLIKLLLFVKQCFSCSTRTGNNARGLVLASNKQSRTHEKPNKQAIARRKF
jgi:hypothetical protein